MIIEDWEFSVPRHAVVFGGYLDAVGRAYTTEEHFFGLSAGLKNDIDWSNHTVKRGQALENWAREFSEDLSRVIPDLDLRNRLGYHLVEYFCWFEEFSVDALAYRVFLSGRKLDDYAAYGLLIDGHEVRVSIAREKKPRERIA
ncbi:MAG: hypothetical protein AAGI44_10360 [Pseudomonadota bacterium]